MSVLHMFEVTVSGLYGEKLTISHSHLQIETVVYGVHISVYADILVNRKAA